MNWPAFTNTGEKCRHRYAKKFCPFTYSHRLSLKLKNSVSAGISTLLRCCSPTAVTWFVVSVVIGITVQTVLSTGTSAHVEKEVLERVPPSTTNRNPSSAVSVVRFALGVVTPLVHSLPDFELSTSSHSMSSSAFSVKTTTRSGLSIPKTSYQNVLFCSTVTTAEPLNSVAGSTSKSYNDPTPVTITDLIFDLWGHNKPFFRFWNSERRYLSL